MESNRHKSKRFYKKREKKLKHLNKFVVILFNKSTMYYGGQHYIDNKPKLTAEALKSLNLKNNASSSRLHRVLEPQVHKYLYSLSHEVRSQLSKSQLMRSREKVYMWHLSNNGDIYKKGQVPDFIFDDDIEPSIKWSRSTLSSNVISLSEQADRLSPFDKEKGFYKILKGEDYETSRAHLVPKFSDISLKRPILSENKNNEETSENNISNIEVNDNSKSNTPSNSTMNNRLTTANFIESLKNTQRFIDKIRQRCKDQSPENVERILKDESSLWHIAPEVLKKVYYQNMEVYIFLSLF